jgi:hypothetical protein
MELAGVKARVGQKHLHCADGCRVVLKGCFYISSYAGDE